MIIHVHGDSEIIVTVPSHLPTKISQTLTKIKSSPMDRRRQRTPMYSFTETFHKDYVLVYSVNLEDTILAGKPVVCPKVSPYGAL